MNIICPSCASNQVSCLGKIPTANTFARRMLTEPLDSGYLYQCISCHLYFRYPRFTKQQLDDLYQQGYTDKVSSVARYRQDWQIASNWIQSHFEQGKVLDIGCFDGEFLALLDHTQYQCYGIEINQIAAQQAQEKGITLISHDLADLTAAAALKFNVVVAIDVIEHVLDPLQFLNNLAKLTLSGGRIIISTGNTESLSWRFMKSRYWYCAIAEHLAFINPRWCSNAAPKCGLVVEFTKQFSHNSKPNSLKQQFAELSKNVLYRFMPTVASWLRQQGFGNRNIDECHELTFYPPIWISAKDHFITVLRKR